MNNLRETIGEYMESFRLILFELSKNDFWFIFFLFLVGTTIWFSLRGLRNWYWKQSRIAESLENMEEILERILELQLRESHKSAKDAPLLHSLFDEVPGEEQRRKRIPEEQYSSARSAKRPLAPSERLRTDNSAKLEEKDKVSTARGTQEREDPFGSDSE